MVTSSAPPNIRCAIQAAPVAARVAASPVAQARAGGDTTKTPSQESGQ
jgi:hypothetical protein